MARQPTLLSPRTMFAKGRYPPHSNSIQSSADFALRLWRNRRSDYLPLSSLNTYSFPKFPLSTTIATTLPLKKASSQALFHTSGLFLSFFSCLDSSYLHLHPLASQDFPISLGSGQSSSRDRGQDRDSQGEERWPESKWVKRAESPELGGLEAEAGPTLLTHQDGNLTTELVLMPPAPQFPGTEIVIVSTKISHDE